MKSKFESDLLSVSAEYPVHILYVRTTIYNTYYILYVFINDFNYLILEL
jgi:hypothetical protein